MPGPAPPVHARQRQRANAAKPYPHSASAKANSRAPGHGGPTGRGPSSGKTPAKAGLELYQEVYRPLGAEYQIAFTLPSGSQRILGVALSRARRDFTATESALLNLSRPYLIQAYRNALTHTALADGTSTQLALADLRALGLTERQAGVLRLVAMGHSDQDAAAALGISVRTAQKHLERCYRTLNVSSRSAASQMAWAAATSAT